MPSANKGWWRDAKSHRSEDAPWRVKCRRMVDQVYSVFFSVLGARTVRTGLGAEARQKVGRQSFQEKRGRNVERILYEDSEGAKDDEAAVFIGNDSRKCVESQMRC